MTNDPVRLDKIKRKIRKLKQLEMKIRFNGIKHPHQNLVWDRFFDLNETSPNETSSMKAKYTLRMLASMSQEEYKNVIDEYFSVIYKEHHQENGITGIQGIYDPAILSRLGLPLDADENDIKSKFRELAKQYHPDAGGDAAMFIELMDDYKKLIRKRK